MHERNVLAQNENTFFCDRLIKYFAWKNYLGQSTGGNCLGSNYLEGNYPGVIVWGQLSRRQLSGGNFSGGYCLGCNYPEGNYPGRQLSWGAFVRGGNCSGGNYLRGNCLGGNYPRGNCPRTKNTISIYQIFC